MIEGFHEGVLPLALPLMLLLLAAILGGTLAGWTGWGGWIVTGAVVWLFFPPLVSLVAAQPVIFAMDGMLFYKERAHINRSRARKLLLLALPGLPLGLFLTATLPQNIIYLLAGVLLLLGTLPYAWKRAHIGLGGFLGGIFTTAGGWNAPPLATGVADLDQNARRGTLGLVFFVLSLLALPLLPLSGISQAEYMQGIVLGLFLAPFALIGMWIGLRTQRTDTALLRIGQVVTALAAMLLILRAL